MKQLRSNQMGKTLKKYGVFPNPERYPNARFFRVLTGYTRKEVITKASKMTENPRIHKSNFSTIFFEFV